MGWGAPPKFVNLFRLAKNLVGKLVKRFAFLKNIYSKTYQNSITMEKVLVRRIKDLPKPVEWRAPLSL